MGDTEDDVVNNRKKIFIGNLPFSIKPADLEAVFSKYGNIIGINVREDRQTGKPKGFAFVTFEEEAAAASALSMNGYSLDDRALTVKWATARGAIKTTAGAPEKDNSWKTVPSVRSSKNSSKSSDKKGGGADKKGGGAVKEKKTWDQWAGPV